MKQIFRKAGALTLALSMSAALLSGCGSSSGKSSSSSTGDVSTVVIGTQEMPNDEGIAKALDYFTEETGVKVSIKNFDSGKDVNTALASGSIDFGLMGSMPAALAIAQGINVEAIWIHEVLDTNECLISRADENLTEVSQLKGKTVAVPFASTAHYSVLHALSEAGLSESDVNLLDMQPDEIYASWQNKEIDATYVWDPTLSSIDNKTVLCTSGELAKKGYMTSNVEVVRKDFADANPKLVDAYIRAVAKAVDLYQNDKDTAVKTISDALELSTEDAEKQMGGSIWLNANEQLGSDYFGTSDSKGAFASNLYDTANALKEMGSITDVPDKSVFEDAVNPKYIEDAVASGYGSGKELSK